jgi:hypothetical protein
VVGALRDFAEAVFTSETLDFRAEISSVDTGIGFLYNCVQLETGGVPPQRADGVISIGQGQSSGTHRPWVSAD